MGFTNTTVPPNPESQVVYIEGTAHCGDMYSTRPTDSPELQWAHVRIAEAVEQYLQADDQSPGAMSPSPDDSSSDDVSSPIESPISRQTPLPIQSPIPASSPSPDKQ